MASQLPHVVPDLECPSFLCQLPLPFRSQRGPFTLCVFPEHKSPVIPGWAQPVFWRAIARRLGRLLMNARRSQHAGGQRRLAGGWAVPPATPPSLRGSQLICLETRGSFSHSRRFSGIQESVRRDPPDAAKHKAQTLLPWTSIIARGSAVGGGPQGLPLTGCVTPGN